MPRKKVENEKGDEDDLFTSFDDELTEMRERMDRIFDAFMRNELGPERAPSVFGFSVESGNDGEPVMREVGNSLVPPQITDREPEERDPLIDVIESKDLITVIVELPGVRKEDIKIDACERLLDVDVDKEFKQFHQQVALPCDVRQDSIKASYKNGVLEISMKRATKKRKARTVRVD